MTAAAAGWSPGFFTRIMGAGLRRGERPARTASAGPLRELHWDRVAPPHVARGLRELNPEAAPELLYRGWGVWRLVERAPMLLRTGHARMADAERLLSQWETSPRVRANPGAKRRLLARHEHWVSIHRGYRPVCEYTVKSNQPGECYLAPPGEPTSAIVADYRRMLWMFRTMSEQDTLTALNAEKDAAQAAAHADLTDPNRGLDAWNYLFIRTHGWEAPNVQRVRSGFTRHPTPTRSIV